MLDLDRENGSTSLLYRNTLILELWRSNTIKELKARWPKLLVSIR